MASASTHRASSSSPFAAAIARHFDMPHGDPAPMNLTREMPAFEPVWGRVVERHRLRDPRLSDLVGSSWQFTDRASHAASKRRTTR